MTSITIRTEYITLGQFLKFANLVSSGADARALLDDGLVRVNGEADTRRGRKLYAGDIVALQGEEFLVTRTNA